MEKLVELLNQFEWDTKYPTWSLSWANEPLYWGWTAYASSYLIPSKNYLFIKWLVKNNKIDFTKDSIQEFWIYWTEWYCDKYDNILMNLAIQDSPIQFLIDILA